MTHDHDAGGGPVRGTAEWLRRKAAGDPEFIVRAQRYLAGAGRSNDACLKARRYLEHYWELDPVCPPSGAEYRRAAHELERAGQPGAAGLFHAIAETDAELAAGARAWTTRYAAWPEGGTQAGLGRVLILADAVIALEPPGPPGIDGAWYQHGRIPRQAGGREAGDPVVLVTTMTTRELVTGFGSDDAADRWVRDRSRTGRPRPLADPAVGELPRVSLEEQVLAWTLRHPGWLPDIGAGLRARMWTADCRHEIGAALHTAARRHRQPGYREISAELGRRMLRVPGWAAAQVGWPFGHWAQAYLQRLAATRVSEDTARRAFHALALTPAPEANAPGRVHDHQAAQNQPVPGLPAGEQPRPEQWRRQHAEFMQQLPPPLARPASLGARVRVHPPQP